VGLEFSLHIAYTSFTYSHLLSNNYSSLLHSPSYFFIHSLFSSSLHSCSSLRTLSSSLLHSLVFWPITHSLQWSFVPLVASILSSFTPFLLWLWLNLHHNPLFPLLTSHFKSHSPLPPLEQPCSVYRQLTLPLNPIHSPPWKVNLFVVVVRAYVSPASCFYPNWFEVSGPLLRTYIPVPQIIYLLVGILPYDWYEEPMVAEPCSCRLHDLLLMCHCVPCMAVVVKLLSCWSPAAE
jgi:hypothetical protein